MRGGIMNKGYIYRLFKTFDGFQAFLMGGILGLFTFFINYLDIFSRLGNRFAVYASPLFDGIIAGVVIFVLFLGFLKIKTDEISGVDFLMLTSAFFTIVCLIGNGIVIFDLAKLIFFILAVIGFIVYFVLRSVFFTSGLSIPVGSKIYFGTILSKPIYLVTAVLGLSAGFIALAVMKNIFFDVKVVQTILLFLGVAFSIFVSILFESIFGRRTSISIFDHLVWFVIFMLCPISIYFLRSFKVTYFLAYSVGFILLVVLIIIRSIFYKGKIPKRCRFKINRYYSNLALKYHLTPAFIVALSLFALIFLFDYAGFNNLGTFVFVLMILLAVTLVVIGVVIACFDIKQKDIRPLDFWLISLDLFAILCFAYPLYQFMNYKLVIALLIFAVAGVLTIIRIEVYEKGFGKAVLEYDNVQGSNPYTKEEYEKYLEEKRNRQNIVQDSYFNQRNFGYDNHVLDEILDTDNAPSLDDDMIASYDQNDTPSLGDNPVNPFERFFEFDEKREAPEEEQEEEDDIDEDEAVELSDSEIINNAPIRQNFLNKIKFLDEKTKVYYSKLKNRFMLYRCHDRLSRKGESFRNRGLIGRISLGGKRLKVYLAIDPNSIDQKKYHHRDVSNKKQYTYIPTMIRITSDRALGLALELIDIIMGVRGLKPKRNFEYVSYEADLQIDGAAILESMGLDNLLRDRVSDTDILDIPMEVDDKIPIIVGTRALEIRYYDVYLDDIARVFDDGEFVTIDTLRKKNILIGGNAINIKARGTFDKKLTIYANSYDFEALKMLLVTGCVIYRIK